MQGFINSTFVDAKTPHKTIYSSYVKFTMNLKLSVSVRDKSHYVVGANILQASAQVFPNPNEIDPDI